MFEAIESSFQLNRIPLTLRKKTLCCFFTAFPLRILRLFAYLFLISELGFKEEEKNCCSPSFYLMYLPQFEHFTHAHIYKGNEE